MPELIVVLALTFFAQSTDAPPVMDGRFDDWSAAAQAPDDGSGLIRAVRVTDSPRHVFVQIDLDRPRTLQWLEQELRLELDLDGRPGTGLRGFGGMEGVEAVVLFSPLDQESGRTRPGTTLYGVNRNGEAVQSTADELGVVALPTHSGDRFEIRLDRSPAFRGGGMRLQFLARDRAGVVDRTPVVEYEFGTKRSSRPEPAGNDPAAAKDPAEVRVVSWNAEFGALFKNPVPFARTFEALDPDIVLLQELPDPVEPSRLGGWFGGLEPKRAWNAVVGGRSLCVAVVTPHPMEPVPELAPVRKSAPSGSVVRATGGLVSFGTRRILAVSIHLKCCGRLGSTEDQKRRSEVEAIHEAVRRATARLKPDSLVIGGDLNLVGGPGVLEALVRDLAPGGGDLVVAEPMRPLGDDVTTWGREGESFVPGRLDFILHDQGLRATAADVVDVEQLGPRWRRTHGIPAEPPSDHLPLKLDLSWEAAPAGAGSTGS
ncbi:MAG: endonuclease/exonuclease/phosphatase family protein [Planctomycetota bacterium]|nr:endonuclease/exonuclease/phosphatase family protein [Planctomycetota bacterium]